MPKERLGRLEWRTEAVVEIWVAGGQMIKELTSVTRQKLSKRPKISHSARGSAHSTNIFKFFAYTEVLPYIRSIDVVLTYKIRHEETNVVCRFHWGMSIMWDYWKSQTVIPVQRIAASCASDVARFFASMAAGSHEPYCDISFSSSWSCAFASASCFNAVARSS